MDVVLDVLDTFFLDRCYAFLLPDATAQLWDNTTTNPLLNQHVNVYYTLPPSQWAEASRWKRDSLPRQTLTLFLLSWYSPAQPPSNPKPNQIYIRAFATTLYLIGSFIMYHAIYDKRLLQHPRYLPNQMHQEINQALTSIPIMSALTVPFFLAEVRGWSKLYDFPSQAPFSWWTLLQYPAFILFTDSGIYWIHRWEHHPRFYRWLHKPHHKWVVPTPFASYAFHPLDGWAQSLPYHVFPFVFPLQKVAYLGLFVFVTIWTVLIRESRVSSLCDSCCADSVDDAEYLSWSTVINDASCHTMHHLYFNYNYGQYLTLWDRLGGTYRTPKGDSFMEAHEKVHLS